MGFIEQARQCAPERIGEIEKADAADAEGAVAVCGQPVNDVRMVGKDEGAGVDGFAARKRQREQSRMRAGACGCGQKTRKKSLMRGIGEAGRRVPALPAAGRKMCGQDWQPSLQEAGLRGVVAQGVEGDEQDVVSADDAVHVDVGRCSRIAGHAALRCCVLRRATQTA